MSRNARSDEQKTVHSAGDFAPLRQKRLDIKQIRSFAEQLQEVQDKRDLPDWSHLTIGDRFAITLRLIPQDQRESLLGKSDSHIRRYERGLDIPLTVVAALAAEAEVPLEWIVSGKPTSKHCPHGCSEDAPAYGNSSDIPVPWLSVRVSAGQLVEGSAEHVRFPRAIVDQAGIAPADARLVQAAGESMRPTINDGDMLLVDVSAEARQVVEGRIYFFAVGNDAFIKRLRRIGDQVLMISDNREMFPDAETVPKDAALRVFGQVKWAGRSL